jgi:hypothetical protein
MTPSGLPVLALGLGCAVVLGCGGAEFRISSDDGGVDDAVAIGSPEGAAPDSSSSVPEAGEQEASLNCQLAGHSYTTNTCTETRQCQDGSWVARSSDPSSCRTGIEASGACLTDTGSVVPQNTCTSTLQCDDGVWVDRVNDPSACL